MIRPAGRTYLPVLLLLCTGLPGLNAQALFEHTATPSNTRQHITTIDHASTNGKANALLIVSQVFGVYNPNETGVWFDDGKWKIFNQNRQPMPANARFNVLVLEGPTSFVHTTTAQNTSGHITTLEGNIGPDACLLVTQQYGRYNTSPVGVWYNAGKWKIYNEDRSPMPVGAKFNVLNLQEAGGFKLGGKFTADVFQHRAAPVTLNGHISKLDHAATNDQPDRKLFITQRYIRSYNPNVAGVWYNAGKWNIFNQNRAAMPENVIFNVLSLTPPPQRLTIPAETRKANLPTTTTTNPATTKPNNTAQPTVINAAAVRMVNPNLKRSVATLKLDPGKWNIRPYTPPKQQGSAPPDAPPSTEIQGPNLAIPKTFSSIAPEPEYASFIDRLHLFRDLYEDKNKNANTYYYLPSSYHLRWQKENGQYSFFIYYLSSTDGGRGEVIITAELNPGIDAAELAMAEKLLSKKTNKTVRLQPMPLKDSPKVSFGSMLANFGIDPASVTINIPTDFLQPIVVSWKMNQRVDDLLGAMMSQIVLSGNVEFSPYAEEDKLITVPIKLKINDPGTYGDMEFDNAEALFNGFYNRGDFPVNLNRLHVMRNIAGGLFKMETIPLGNYQVAPGAIFSSFQENEKTRVLSGPSVGKIWLDYSLSDCPDCNSSVQQKILGGTSASRMKTIQLEVLTAIAFVKDSLQGAYLKFRIKSKQGDPNGASEVVFPFVDVRADETTLKLGDLLVPEGGAIDLQYQAFLVLEDGTLLEGPWVTGTQDFITLGIRQIRDWFVEETP